MLHLNSTDYNKLINSSKRYEKHAINNKRRGSIPAFSNSYYFQNYAGILGTVIASCAVSKYI